jgi:hypothetical protein
MAGLLSSRRSATANSNSAVTHHFSVFLRVSDARPAIRQIYQMIFPMSKTISSPEK